MRRAITIGTLVDLMPFNNKEGSRTVAVKEVLGEGAGSIAYLVEEDGLQFVMNASLLPVQIVTVAERWYGAAVKSKRNPSHGLSGLFMFRRV